MKKWVLFLLAIVLILGVAQRPVQAVSFKDVSTSHGFHDEIKYLSDKQFITGYSDGSFRPEKAVTRGEAAIMIGKAFDLDGTQRTTKFKDVGKSQKASGYIASAVEKGIISGYSNGTFKPEASISRGEMAIILSRAFNLSFHSFFRFKDVGESTAAFEHIQRLAAASITAGYPDGTFQPGLSLTRAQFSAFLARGFDVSFKQKAAIQDSYVRDKTKQYTYQSSELGREVFTYKKASVWEWMFPEYMWEAHIVDQDQTYHFFEVESYEGSGIGYPLSEFHESLIYPIKLGATWTSYTSTSKVTGIGKKVETPYKTFTNAVEVTSSEGTKTYYVKHVGYVQTIDKGGKVIRELVDIK
ncbi:S-layer homology domain-containing protein [Sporosarcina sp. HYO08]|uniref:S-layer homology domain-containing protein n=1 Tax=Sporosarcina sp. HYO08 TaxID=1759557 RepID=UPI00079ADD9A|nr:S-layer homology domain-containing protein [Sporosarcina sp. HYO08]KXH84051.1 hypothetical protein AU377_04670 [Sporosarcina sp. HYO08]